MHAALAEHFGGLPRAVWSGCCTACILQGNARLSGRVDGLGAQLAAVGASASEEHERAAAALTASLLAKRLSCQEGRAAALALAARIDNFEAEEDGSPKLSAVYHEVRFRAGPSVAPFDKLSHHAALVDTVLACGLLVWTAHPLPHKPEGSNARVAVSAGLLRPLSDRNASLPVLLYRAPPPSPWHSGGTAEGSARGSEAGGARAEAALQQEAMAHASTLTASVAALRRLLRITQDPNALLAQLPREARLLVLQEQAQPRRPTADDGEEVFAEAASPGRRTPRPDAAYPSTPPPCPAPSTPTPRPAPSTPTRCAVGLPPTTSTAPAPRGEDGADGTARLRPREEASPLSSGAENTGVTPTRLAGTRKERRAERPASAGESGGGGASDPAALPGPGSPPSGPGATILRVAQVAKRVAKNVLSPSAAPRLTPAKKAARPQRAGR